MPRILRTRREGRSVTAARDAAPPLPPCEVIPIAGRARGQLGSALDGRYGALDPAALQQVMAWLARRFRLEGVDYVVGIPEGGLVPAFAFAEAVNLPVVLGSIWKPAIAGIISFEEEHNPAGRTGKHIVGLRPGDCVIVIEDELTSGRTLINCVRAMRAAGIRCDQVGAIYAADDASLRARIEAEGLALHVAGVFDVDLCRQLYARRSS